MLGDATLAAASELSARNAAGILHAAGKLAAGGLPPPPLPPLRTKWTRRVPHPVLIGHAASLTPYR